MISNFEIADLIAICLKGQEFDLHNCFDFKGFNFEASSATIVLNWTKSEGEWVPQNYPDSIIIAHEGVTYLKVLPSDPNAYPKDQQCLNSLALVLTNERDNDEQFLLDRVPSKGHDIIYWFENGLAIRIGCVEATVTVAGAA